MPSNSLIITSTELAPSANERVIKAYEDARQARISLGDLNTWITASRASNQNLLERLAELSESLAARRTDPPTGTPDVPRDNPTTPTPPSGQSREATETGVSSTGPPTPPSSGAQTRTPQRTNNEIPPAANETPAPPNERLSPGPATVTETTSNEDVLGAIATIIDQFRERLEHLEARLARLEMNDGNNQ